MVDFVLSFIFGLLMSFLHLFVDTGTEVRVPAPPAERTSFASRLVPVPNAPEGPSPKVESAPSSIVASAPTIEAPAPKAQDESDALFSKLKGLNLDAPLKKQDLEDLDAIYDEVGAYVAPDELKDLLRKNPKNLDELRDLVEENEEKKWGETRKRENELLDSLAGLDMKKPLSGADMEKFRELQEIYGLELSDDEVREIAADSKNVDDFLDKAFETDGQYQD